MSSQIEELHQNLENYRIENRISYKRIGEIIGYTDVGVKKAINKKTLKIQQLNIIATQLGLNENFFSIDSKEDSNKVPNDAFLKKLSVDCITNWDELIKFPYFSRHIEGYILKELSLNLKDIIQKHQK